MRLMTAQAITIAVCMVVPPSIPMVCNKTSTIAADAALSANTNNYHYLTNYKFTIMKIELSGLYGWIVVSLCAAALIIGLVAIITHIIICIEKNQKRRITLGKGEQITDDADAKLVYLLEEIFPVDAAAELERAILDPYTSYECMGLIYENIKFKIRNNEREKQTDQRNAERDA